MALDLATARPVALCTTVEYVKALGELLAWPALKTQKVLDASSTSNVTRSLGEADGLQRGGARRCTLRDDALPGSITCATEAGPGVREEPDEEDGGADDGDGGIHIGEEHSSDEHHAHASGSAGGDSNLAAAGRKK
jgi:hypothetical protein